MSDNDLVQNAITGYITDIPSMSNAANAAKQLVKRRKVSVPLSDGGTAASASGEVNFFRADVPCKVISVTFDGGIAITADNTNFATPIVQKRPLSAPASPVTVATNDTKITDAVFGANYVADTPLAMTLSAAANLAMVAGDILTAKMTKGGSGVAVGAAATAKGAQAYLHIVYEES